MIFCGWKWLDAVTAVPIEVSVLESEGGALVELWVGYDSSARLEPDDARAVADRLIKAADRVDENVGDDGDLGGWPAGSEDDDR
jgi:hypothetical protein